MPDQELHNDRSELIMRYLSGNAGDAEVQELEAWVLADPEHRAQFIALKKAWLLSGMEQNAPPINVDQQWKQTATQVFGQTKVVAMQPKRARNTWLRIAAAVVLLAGVSIWAIVALTGERAITVTATNEVRSADLPDGSHITLNQLATLTYTPVRADKATGQSARRLVVLEGDAYFDVAREEARPFIIRTKDVEIEVLGTSFYVDARDQQAETQVIVESGTVAVRADTAGSVTLQAGEKAVYHKTTGELLEAQNEDANYQSIKTRTLVFDHTPLEEVVFTLNRYYHADIVSQVENPGNCEVNTIFEDYDLEDALAVLTSTWKGIAVERAGNRIILTGTGCK